MKRFLILPTLLSLLLVRTAVFAADVNIYIHPGYGITTYDDYRVEAVFSARPGTPDGWYLANRTVNGGPAGYWYVQVQGGVVQTPVSPTLVEYDKGYWLPEGTSTWQVTGENVSTTSVSMRRVDIYDADWTPGFVRLETLNVVVGPLPAPAPTPGPNTTDNDKQEPSTKCSIGMATYGVHSMLVSLRLEDTPVGYTPPVGPAVTFRANYNQRDSQQPAAFAHSNLGPKWTFNWLSYVSDDPATQLPAIGVYVPGGGAEIYPFDSATQTFASHPQSHATLVKTGTASYERRFPDGSKQVYALSDGATAYPRRIFMTQMIDPAGNAATIGYDGSFRVATITDALSQVTTLSYELAGDPLKITKVTDPFGRFATFQYVGGQLSTITDTIGIQSQVTYVSGTATINSLTTPYGTTNFVSGENGTNRWIKITDPLGGKERVEYRDNAPGIAAADLVAPNAAGVTNAGPEVANTFYWDKKAMSVAPGDYTKAKITHWLYNADGSVSGIVGSEKQPLENRVWLTYAGQADYLHAGPSANPSQVARVLADGSTQLSQFEYNSLGNRTKATDPAGRATSYIYASDNVDLLEVRQTTGTSNELLRKFTYNGQHLPLTETDAAAQVTTFTYNAQGQILTRKNAKNEITTYAYGGTAPAGHLESVTSPPFNAVSAVTRFGYDSMKRVRTVTDSDNYSVTTDYDNLDRRTKITYPDTTYQESKYTDNVTGVMTLDLTGSRDRRGLWTYRHYNANRQMDSITDPQSRTTLYDWCSCGSLQSITDANNHTTTFNRDLQGRVYQKVFADTKTINYLFEGQTAPNTAGATSRLKSATDAMGQTTNYAYFADDNLQQVSYTNALLATPAVSYTYDPNYSRVATMVDGTGTTAYGYYPIATPPVLGAGQLQTVDGRLANDTITYSYDEVGRRVSRSLNGVSSGITYDTLGRSNSAANALGAFTYGYVGVTPRLDSLSYPNGHTVGFGYFPNAQDRRLEQIREVTQSGAEVYKLNYTYDYEGLVKTWTQQIGTQTPSFYDIGYDYADQLKTAPIKDTNTQALLRQYSYDYDLAGNRTSEQAGSTSTAFTPNYVNQLTQVTTGGVNTAVTYDFNGNMTSDGVRSYQWDAANRLRVIIYPNAQGSTEFMYDGLSRRVQVLEKDGGNVVQKQTNFVWDALALAEERNTSNTVLKRFEAQGVSLASAGAKRFYGKDHLGSTRSMSNENGVVVGTFDYDPYGRITRSPVPTNGTSVGPVITGAVSRLTHGTAGTFDLPLALSGSPTIEMRNGSGNHTVVVTFDRPISSASATIASGAATAGAPVLSGNTATVSLTGVADRQTLTLELDNVTPTSGAAAPKVLVALSMLIGDVDQSGAVATEDVKLVTNFSGGVTSSSTFVYDVAPSGTVNSGDSLVTKNKHNDGASLLPDLAYTGHYYHARSGLYLAPYRAYSANLARWLSRDPFGEVDGPNVYAYVHNDPLDLVDSDGLFAIPPPPPAALVGPQVAIAGAVYAGLIIGDTAGSLINLIPTGGGKNVGDRVTDLIYNTFYNDGSGKGERNWERGRGDDPFWDLSIEELRDIEKNSCSSRERERARRIRKQKQKGASGGQSGKR